MKKSLLFAGLLSLTSMMFAATKSYDLIFAAPTKVGGVQLPKGNYKMQVEGDKVVFTDAHLKTVSVPVKLETSTGKKFQFTSVEASEKDGSLVVKSIKLNGSNTTVEFGDLTTNAN